MARTRLPLLSVFRVLFAFAKPVLAGIAIARLLAAVLVDENGLLVKALAGNDLTYTAHIGTSFRAGA
jgi:hypothetical protein